MGLIVTDQTIRNYLTTAVSHSHKYFIISSDGGGNQTRATSVTCVWLTYCAKLPWILMFESVEWLHLTYVAHGNRRGNLDSTGYQLDYAISCRHLIIQLISYPLHSCMTTSTKRTFLHSVVAEWDMCKTNVCFGCVPRRVKWIWSIRGCNTPPPPRCR